MQQGPKPDRSAEWVRAHPRLASAAALLIVFGIFAAIAFNEARKAGGSDFGDGYGWLKGVALVAGALFIVWRARKKMRL
jgi:hypothetical protein